ncbi:hypothetical protein E5C31_11390 [Providencia rettgeri]|nr:hypothetical protein [Providencia rettgeri]
MRKEDADQLIRRVKECWWRVLVLFLLPIGMLWLALHGFSDETGNLLSTLISLAAAIGTVGALLVGIKAPQKLYDKDIKLQERNHSQELLALQRTMNDVAGELFEIVRSNGYFSGLLVKRIIGAPEGERLAIDLKIKETLDILETLVRSYLASFESVSWDVYPKSKIASEIISFLNIMRFYVVSIEKMKQDYGELENLRDRAEELTRVLLSVHEKVGVGDYDGPTYRRTIRYKRVATS